jgi:hypothetical protein
MKRTLSLIPLALALCVAIAAPSSTANARPRARSSGLVAGQKCPAFSYRTVTGKRVTNSTFKGKAFLIDIWSTT